MVFSNDNDESKKSEILMDVCPAVAVFPWQKISWK